MMHVKSTRISFLRNRSCILSPLSLSYHEDHDSGKTKNHLMCHRRVVSGRKHGGSGSRQLHGQWRSDISHAIYYGSSSSYNNMKATVVPTALQFRAS
jgi:hypothetical protein